MERKVQLGYGCKLSAIRMEMGFSFVRAVEDRHALSLRIYSLRVTYVWMALISEDGISR